MTRPIRTAPGTVNTMPLGQDSDGYDFDPSDANDSFEWSFDQIADAIERVAKGMTTV